MARSFTLEDVFGNLRPRSKKLQLHVIARTQSVAAAIRVKEKQRLLRAGAQEHGHCMPALSTNSNVNADARVLPARVPNVSDELFQRSIEVTAGCETVLRVLQRELALAERALYE